MRVPCKLQGRVHMRDCDRWRILTSTQRPLYKKINEGLLILYMVRVLREGMRHLGLRALKTE